MGFDPLIRFRTGMVVAASAAAAILLAVGAAGIGHGSAAPTGSPFVDMNGHPVQLDPGEPIPSPQPSAALSTSMRLIVDASGLDVPLVSLDVVDGQITPPGFTSAYVVRNLGVSPAQASAGTVYVVMHSLRGGGVAPGNFLIDVDSGTARVPTGAQIRVGDDIYAVTGWRAVKKTDVPTDADLWRNVPGRLVIITCLQVPAQTSSVDNMVITASLVSSGN